MGRDDFNRKIKEIVAKRAAYICSNPKCRRNTLSPSRKNPEKFLYTGEIAHITAAAPGGPRYDPALTEEQRASVENGIHLCSICATMIDKNQGVDFPANLLKKWKVEHEKGLAENPNQQLFETQDENEKRAFILQMGSPTNSFAIEAVRALRALGWLQDGTLEGITLSEANLQNANLSTANLKGANLSNANLQNVNFTNANLEDSNMMGANLRETKFHGANLKNANLKEVDLKDAQGLIDEQLAKVNSLLGATMVSGKRYNGRFNLESELLMAHFMKIGRSDQALANFYGVSVENYQWGQEWHRFRQSPPLMYSPDLEKWHRITQTPEGLYD